MVDRTDNSQGNQMIHHILTRKSVFARKSAGSKEELQIVATNIDTVFICMSLNHDFNLRRLSVTFRSLGTAEPSPLLSLQKQIYVRI